MFNTKQNLNSQQYTNQLNNCPSCKASSQESQMLFQTRMLGENSSVVRCSKCNLIYKTLIPNQQGLSKIYSQEYVHFQEKNDAIDVAEINSAEQKLNKCHKLLKNNLSKSKIRILDVGCGSGKFVDIARQLGYNPEGVDPYLPDSLQNNYLHKKSPEEIASNSYDIATLLNVAEHLDRPELMFSAIHKLLKPNGVFLLTCPYGNSMARKVYKDRWNHLVLDEHLLFWTPQSLTHLLRQIGFQGKVSYRISGSPFPQGKANISSNTPTVTTNAISSDVVKTKTQSLSLNSRIWQMGKAIQRRKTVASLVRHLIHISHLGDYLEYAIIK